VFSNEFLSRRRAFFPHIYRYRCRFAQYSRAYFVSLVLSTVTCSTTSRSWHLLHDSPLKANIPSSRSYYNLYTFRSGGPSHSHAYIITAFRQHSQLFIYIAIIINLSSPLLVHQTIEKRAHVSSNQLYSYAFLQISLFSTLPGVFIRFRLGSYIFGMYQYHHLQGCR